MSRVQDGINDNC